MLLRANSEDVFTATVFSILKNISPEKWLADWLNDAFHTQEFTGAQFENLVFELWPSLSPPPGLRHREGSSKPDLIIKFDDVVIMVEAKYTSPLSSGTAHHSGRNQVIRFLDVANHHFGGSNLFARRVYLMTLTLDIPELINRYQTKANVVQDLLTFDCNREAAERMADTVAVGASTWRSLSTVLARNLDAFGDNPVEEAFVLDAITYLVLKIGQAAASQSPHSQCRRTQH